MINELFYFNRFCIKAFATVNEYLQKLCRIMKRTVYPKFKILSSVTHPQVVPNLYEFISSSVDTKRRNFEECW